MAAKGRIISHILRTILGPVTPSFDAKQRELARLSRVDPLPNMTIIMVMSDSTLPLAEIKKRLSEIIDGVETHHDRVVLTRNGRPAAVILSPDDLESLEETVEILSNPVAVRAIRKAETEIDKGKSFNAEDLRAKYLKR